MLITQLKPKGDILSLAEGKTIIINCEGCKEAYYPEIGATEVQNELLVSRTVLGIIVTDYVCSPESLELQLFSHIDKISAADTVLVFSCGIGVQAVAEMFAGKAVFAACDTYPLPGIQGLTPLEYDCAQCGECYLNGTGGICPITACSKSLVNGQCGGTKNGKCEVDKNRDCGWERIYRRLKALELSGDSRPSIRIRSY